LLSFERKAAVECKFPAYTSPFSLPIYVLEFYLCQKGVTWLSENGHNVITNCCNRFYHHKHACKVPRRSNCGRRHVPQQLFPYLLGAGRAHAGPANMGFL
jgi:hypothetical protein